MTDLSRALGRLGTQGEHAAGEAPLDTVLARRRRRRVVRRSAAAAGAVAGAAVLALAGATLTGPVRDVPPAATGPVITVPALPACGASVPEDAPDPAWVMGTDLPADAAVDMPLLRGDVLLRPAGGSATFGHRATALVVVADGVVVGASTRHAAGGERTATVDDPARVPVTGVLAACTDEAPLPAGTYTVVPALEVVPGGTADAVWLLGPGRELPITGPAWSAAEADALPDLPLVEGRVLEVLRHTDGERWAATVEASGGRETAGTVRDLLEDAGYRVVSEEADPARESWWTAHLVGPYDVVVDVSNETGGGFFVSYSVRER